LNDAEGEGIIRLKKGIPFPLIEWAWSPELDMKIPYRREKQIVSFFSFPFSFLVGKTNLRPSTIQNLPLY
jgi:hypothetical protein